MTAEAASGGNKEYKIAISGSYGGMNLGDEAILQGMLSQLRGSIQGKVTVFSRNADDTLARQEVDHSLAIRNLTRDEARSAVRDLDLLILGGGGILYDADAETYLREVVLAQELGVPVFVYAVSVGPLSTRQARTAVRDALNRAAVLTVRDRQGKQLLEDLGVTRPIRVTADPALLINPEPLPADGLIREGLDGKDRLVAFSVREPGPAAPDINEEQYHRLLANAADFIVDRLDADVVFIPLEHGRDTRHSHAVIAGMHHAARTSVLRGKYSPGQLLSFLSHCEFALGMRLHFLIFAALQGVPFVALPYASKVAGFIEALEVSMPPLRNLNAGQLIAYIDRQWDTRDEVRVQISSKLPELKERARETNTLVTRLLTEQVVAAA